MPGLRAPRLRVLLLCDDRRDHANTVLDHIAAFKTLSRHDVRTFNPRGLKNSLALDLDEFDAVVIHYSLVLSSKDYVSEAFRDKLRRFRGLKVQFIQDEYRWVDRATEASRDAGVEVLFTCAPEPAAGQLYDDRLPGVRRVHTLTGYVPAGLEARPLRPLGDRRVDVAYRGRDLPYWLGRLTQEKTWIAQGFEERAGDLGLITDIGWREQDRVYGDAWIELISSARATLGTESGASIADFDGSVEAAVTAYLTRHRGAQYDEVYDAVLRPYEGNVVVNVISPRVFEAAALGTALVMFPGTYSGVVQPGRHYIVLEKDFSNLDEVADQIKDDGLITNMTRATHDDLIGSGRWSYRAFIAEFDDVMSEEAADNRRGRYPTRYGVARLERSIRIRPPHRLLLRASAGLASRISGGQNTVGERLDLRAAIRKGGLAMRMVFGDPSLRALYRAGRQARLPRGELLVELVNLSILRHALLGDVPSSDGFFVSSAYDPSSGALRFASEPGPPRPAADALTTVRAALSAHNMRSIEWDHSGVAPAVEVGRSGMVRIGKGGCQDFRLISEIAQRDPELVERAFAAALDVPLTPASLL